jgi:DNA-binding NtrC family response regulator
MRRRCGPSVAPYATKIGRRIERIPERLMTALAAHAWPGNVRELEHVIERALIVSDGPELAMPDWLQVSRAPSTQGATQLAADADRRFAGAIHRRFVVEIPVAVPVEVQTGTGADLDQRERSVTRKSRDEQEGGKEVRAPPDFVGLHAARFEQ